MHRDYSFSGSIIINVNDERIEFISIRGLLPGLSTDDIRIGISQPRNKNLAEMFHRLRLIESYGTGIRRIYKQYENCRIQPMIEATTNAFRITLPNMNTTGTTVPNHTSPVTSQMQKVLDYISEHGQITEDEVQVLFKKTRAFTLLKQLREMNLVFTEGRGKGKRYVAK